MERPPPHPSARGPANVTTVQVRPEISLGIATWNVNHFGKGNVDDTALSQHLALTRYAIEIAPLEHLKRKLRRSHDRFLALCEQLNLKIEVASADAMQEAFNRRYKASRGSQPPRKVTKKSSTVEEPQKTRKPPPPGLKAIFPPRPGRGAPLLDVIQAHATELQKQSLAYWLYDNCTKPMNVELKKRAVALATAKLFAGNPWLDVLIIQEVNSFPDFRDRVQAALATLGLDQKIGIRRGSAMKSVGKKSAGGQSECYPILHRLKRTRYVDFFLLDQDGSMVTFVDGGPQQRRWCRNDKVIATGPFYRWDKHGGTGKKTYRPVVVHRIQIAAGEGRWQRVHVGVVHTTPGTGVGEREFDRRGEYAQLKGAFEQISERVDTKNEWWVIGGDYYLLDEALVDGPANDEEKELFEQAIRDEEREKEEAYEAKNLSLPPLGESIVKTERIDYLRNIAPGLTFKNSLPENLRIAAAVTGSNWHAPALLWDGPDAYVEEARKARAEARSEAVDDDSSEESEDGSEESDDGSEESDDEHSGGDEALGDEVEDDGVVIDDGHDRELVIHAFDGSELLPDEDESMPQEVDGVEAPMDLAAEEVADARARAAYFATARVADFFVSDTKHWTRERVGLFNPYWDGGGIVLADSEGTLECSSYWSYVSDHFPIGGMFLGGKRFNLDSIVSTVTEARAAAAWLDRFRLASRFTNLHQRIAAKKEAAAQLPKGLDERGEWTGALREAVMGFNDYRKQRTGETRVWSDPGWPGADAFAEGDRTMGWDFLCAGIVAMEAFLELPEEGRMELTQIDATYFGVEGLKGLNDHFEEDELPRALVNDSGNPSVSTFLVQQARGDHERQQAALRNFYAGFLESMKLEVGRSTSAHHDCLLHTFIQLEKGAPTLPDREAFAAFRRRIKLPASGMTEIGGREVQRWLRARKICVRLWALNIDGTVKLYTIGPEAESAMTWNVLYYGAHYVPLWRSE